jgi:hypothetical protein
VLKWLAYRDSWDPGGWCFEVAKVSWLFECRGGWGVEEAGVLRWLGYRGGWVECRLWIEKGTAVVGLTTDGGGCCKVEDW